VLQFLKLGGSLITDKHKPHTVKPEVIQRLVEEIRQARIDLKDLQLVLGHGSGSFGHVAAKKFGTRSGVHTPEQWLGFAEVWQQARYLNTIVLNAMHAANLPAIAFPPSAIIQADHGKSISWNPDPIRSALNANLIPVVNGDVIFDRGLGGTIFSTEDVFQTMVNEFVPHRILLCGLEEGVWLDFPVCSKLQGCIDLSNADEVLESIGGSSATDVTGGMIEKVKLMLSLITKFPQLEALIFSGTVEGNLYRALQGENIGTLICAHSDI
jgi:isopentenyl phosphate kinase